ncbi:MAG: MinD/ParA family protein [Planctomycetota bacterium]|nr:MAG: MinD/ParA family protein [Planctomycetota bacterium]
MNWAHARSLIGLAHASTDASREAGRRLPARSICVASGKGGTGKSVISASLAALLSRRGRVLLVDADLGAGNAHILQNASPERSLVDVVQGEREIDEVLTACGPQLDLLAAGCGVPHMAGLSAQELASIADGLRALELDYDWCIVDSAAGLSDQTLAFARGSDVVVIVTTPDLTAMTDAYAFYKVLSSLRGEQSVGLLVNRAGSAEEAESVAQRVEEVSQRFLGHAPSSLGWLCEDARVRHAVNNRRPVVREDPAAAFSSGIERLVERIDAQFEQRRPHGLGAALSRH